MSLPSVARPTGFLKKVVPKGPDCAGKAAQNPPVSEFESPKLKIALNSHFEQLERPKLATNTTQMHTNIVSGFGLDDTPLFIFFLAVGDKIQVLFPCMCVCVYMYIMVLRTMS